MPFVFGLAFLITSGCAHNRAGNSATPNQSADIMLTTSDQKPSQTGKNQPLNDEDDEFMDELEEEYADQTTLIADPLASWNRAMFKFNDKLYFWALKPIASGYRAITPLTFRTGVRNFFNNLLAPIRFVNCLLQFKLEAASTELARFMVNSTVGVLGFGDIAKDNPDLAPPPAEDFGQTLATYKIGNGLYIVWPFFGPSSLRDSVGLVGDYFLNPISYIEPVEASMGTSAFQKVNATTFQIGDYEAFKKSSIEPYEALRNGYIQLRNKKISE